MTALSGSHKREWTYDTLALCAGVLLLMYKSHKIIYVRSMSEIMIYAAACLLFLIYAVCNFKKLEKFDLFRFSSVILLAALLIYDMFRVSEMNVFSLFGTCVKTFGGALLILAPLSDKEAAYKMFLWATEIIVGIALAGWILFLIGVPLPNYTDNFDVFYTYQNYYIFNLNLDGMGGFLTRFAGPFLEPGHNATMCVFLLYINGFNLKKIGNIILLLSVLFSLSLAGYGLLIGAVLITLIYKRMYVTTLISAGLFIAIGVGSAYYLKGENPVYEIVFSRLEMNENGDDIVGNNRTSSFFDMAYGKYIKSDNIWTGMGRRAYGSRSDGSDNVTNGSAGWQRYYYVRGVVGIVLVLAFLFYYWGHYRCAKSLGFLIIFLVANIIRDYPTKEIWLYLYLMAMPLIYVAARKRESRQAEALSRHAAHT